MSSNEFLNFLDTTTTPERKLGCQLAIETLMAAGNRDIEFMLDGLMVDESIDGAGNFLLAAETLLSGAEHAIIAEFGVLLADTTPLKMSTDILKGLLALSNWEDKATLAQICEQDENAEAILSDLLAMVGTAHSSDYLVHITHVSPELIDRIDAVNATYAPEALPSNEERERAHQRVTRFFEIAQSPILSRAIREMLLLGGDYHAMMEPYHDAVSELPIPEAMTTLTGFALASELTDTALEEAILVQAQGWWNESTLAPAQTHTLVQALLKKVLTP